MYATPDSVRTFFDAQHVTLSSAHITLKFQLNLIRMYIFEIICLSNENVW